MKCAMLIKHIAYLNWCPAIWLIFYPLQWAFFRFPELFRFHDSCLEPVFGKGIKTSTEL